MSKYGYFSEFGDEYIIKRPDTPKPWINYLTNGRFCSLISQTGGGYCFLNDAGKNRILAEEPAIELITDRPGRYVYIRDNDKGEYWSANWQPVHKTLAAFEARHGLGFTHIKSQTNGIATDMTFYVPLEDDLEVWRTIVTNESSETRNLTLYFNVEFSLGDVSANLQEGAFNALFYDSAFDKKTSTILVSKHRFEKFEQAKYSNNVAWFNIGQTVDEFETSKEKFWGMYGTRSHPHAVHVGKLEGITGNGHHTMAVLSKRIVLKPGAKVRFNVNLGMETVEGDQPVGFNDFSKTNNLFPLVKKYSSDAAVDKALADVRAYWEDYIKAVWVKTPDFNFNTSVNYWMKYQSWMTATWSLMDSYYIGGSGTLGFRDMSQHILGVMPHDIEFARRRLGLLLTKQQSDGRPLHNWNATTGKGEVSSHSDDIQWLVTAVVWYLQETADFEWLKTEFPYYDKDKGSVLDHLIRGMELTLGNFSERGLALKKTSDWNDALDAEPNGEKAESTMVNMQLAYNLQPMIEILKRANQAEKATEYEKRLQDLKLAINKYLWDGKWFVRGVTESGKPVGGQKSSALKIDLNAQTWAVISGVTDTKKATLAMENAWSTLGSPYGLHIFLPAFTKPDPKYGIVTQFAPGTKENAAIFQHPNSWAIIAECILGRSDLAYELWKQGSYMTRGEEPEVYKAEPYVYCEFIYGKDHCDFGRGSFSWTTGSASWFYRGAIDYILGVRPTFDGLMINPSFPKGWSNVSIKRQFRGCTYSIEFRAGTHNKNSVQTILVDGKKIEGNILPLFPDGEHDVEVVLG